MRKTRLVILPGARCLHQLGFLLLFLACPTIAFKGQENRDIQPYCKLLSLKQNWLPNDTSEAEGYDENKMGDINGLRDFSSGFENYCPNNNTLKFDGISSCQSMADVLNLESFGSKLKPTTYVLLKNQDTTITNNDLVARRTKSLPNTISSSGVVNNRRKIRTEICQEDVNRRIMKDTHSVSPNYYVHTNLRDLSTRRNARRESVGNRQSLSRDVDSERRQYISRHFVKSNYGEKIQSRFLERNMNIIRRTDKYERNGERYIKLRTIQSGFAKRLSNRKTVSSFQREFREDERKTRINPQYTRREDSSDRHSRNTPQLNIERINSSSERGILPDKRNFAKRSTQGRFWSLERFIQRQRLDSRNTRRSMLEERRDYDNVHSRNEMNTRNRSPAGPQDSLQDRRSESRIRLEFRRQQFPDQTSRNLPLYRSTVVTESRSRAERQVVREKRDTRRNMFKNVEMRESVIHRSLSSVDNFIRQNYLQHRGYLRRVESRSSSLEPSRQYTVNERLNGRRLVEITSRLTSPHHRVERRTDARKIRSFRVELVVQEPNYETGRERRNTEITSRLTSLRHLADYRNDGRKIRSASVQPIRQESNYESVNERRNTDIAFRQFSPHRRGDHNINSRNIRSVSLDSSRRNADINSRLHRNDDRRIDANGIRSVSMERISRQESNYERVTERRNMEIASRQFSLNRRNIQNTNRRSISLVSSRRNADIVSRLHRNDDRRNNANRIRGVSIEPVRQESNYERVSERRNTEVTSRPSTLNQRAHRRIEIRSIRSASVENNRQETNFERITERRSAKTVTPMFTLRRNDVLNINGRRIRSVSLDSSRRSIDIAPKLSSFHRSVDLKIDTRSTVLHSIRKRSAERREEKSAVDIRRQDYFYGRSTNINRVKSFSVSPGRRASEQPNDNNRIINEHIRLAREGRSLVENSSRRLSRRLLNVSFRNNKENIERTEISFSVSPTHYTFFTKSINRDRRSNKRTFEKRTLDETRIFEKSTRQRRTLAASDSSSLRTSEQESSLANVRRGLKSDFVRTENIKKFTSRQNSVLQRSVIRSDESRKLKNLAAERSNRRNFKEDNLRSLEKIDNNSRVQRNKRLIRNNFLERQLIHVAKEADLNRVSFSSSSLKVFNVIAAYVSSDLGHRNLMLPQKIRLERSSFVHSARQDGIQFVEAVDKRRFISRNERTRQFDSLNKDIRLITSVKNFKYQGNRLGEKYRLNSERQLSHFDRRENNIRRLNRESFRQQQRLEKNTRLIERSLKGSADRSYIFRVVKTPSRLHSNLNIGESTIYKTTVGDQIRFEKIGIRDLLPSKTLSGEKLEYLNTPNEYNILAYTANIITEQFSEIQKDLTQRLWYNNRNNEGYTMQALISGTALCAALFLNVNKKKEIY